MEMKNLILVFFIIVIVLVVISLIPSEGRTGNFIMPSIISLEVAVLIIIFSLFAICAVLSKKSYYPF